MLMNDGTKHMPEGSVHEWAPDEAQAFFKSVYSASGLDMEMEKGPMVLAISRCHDTADYAALAGTFSAVYDAAVRDAYRYDAVQHAAEEFSSRGPCTDDFAVNDVFAVMNIMPDDASRQAFMGGLSPEIMPEIDCHLPWAEGPKGTAIGGMDDAYNLPATSTDGSLYDGERTVGYHAYLAFREEYLLAEQKAEMNGSARGGMTME